MNSESRKIYYILIGIFIAFVILVLIAFSLLPSGGPEGWYITIGNTQTEWTFAILMYPLMLMIAGLFSLYFISPLVSKLIFKSTAKKHKLGLAPTRRLKGSSLFIRIFGRSTLLALFAFNICYNLASQEFIVQFMRSVSPSAPYSIPDVDTLLHLLWIVIVPCTIIIIPIWVLIDAGVISTKKIKGIDFEFTNLGTSSLYKIIKGYVGIVFIYNLLAILLVRFGPSGGHIDPQSILSLILGMISPIVGICLTFPLVIYIDYRKDRSKERVENILRKLKLNRDISCVVKLKDREFDA
ncbi:MAG: hypothetical protein ACTSQW_08390 [Promethearchaeota archaeon]